jgi:hypothetical protein
LLQKSGVLLAEFAFLAPTYDAEADETNFFATLTPEQTSALKITRYQGVGEIASGAAYFYDIEVESEDGTVIKFAPGAVFVVGEVTGPGVPPAPLELFFKAESLVDKALYFYDSLSGLMKPLEIGLEGQALIAQPDSDPPYRWNTPWIVPEAEDPPPV